ncbi:MAG: glycine cleavage T C-terminal barrel domain-containing protein [Acidimicrobiia bacterium]
MTDLPAVFEHTPWGLVVVHGPDATSFLQAIVSQDLDPVGVGQTVPALLLQPQGKLEVAFRATRRGEQEWLLDTDPAYAARLAEGLTRYKIRVKVEIEDRTADTAMASVVGVTTAVGVAGALVVAPTVWGAAPGCDVLGSEAFVRGWVRDSGLRVGTPEQLEVLRIEAGLPKLGVDVDDATIPQEAFLEVDAVSFTKGCFIGQELVCRIDSRGHVNRFLRRLAIPGGAVPPHGAEVLVGDKSVGHVTSAVAVPGEDRAVALAMVRREVEPPADVVIRSAGTTTPATVIERRRSPSLGDGE